MNNTGQIVRSREESNFTIIPNEILRNPNMTAKAKGVLCFLLSLPTDWVLYKNTLPNYFFDGKESISSAWNELVELGYIVSVRIIGEDNLTKGWNHIVYSRSCKPEIENEETPIESIGSSEVGFSDLREPVTPKTRHYKERDYKERTNKRVYTPEKKQKSVTTFVPPTLEQVVDYFVENGYSTYGAKKAYNHYAVADWCDVNGKKVKNWKQKVSTVWFKPEYEAKGHEADAPIRYKMLWKKGWKNCTLEELQWVWDYQHRTPTSYIEFPDNELIKTRGNSKTAIEYENE